MNDFSDSEERVRKGAEKLQKYLNSKQQGRLDSFFTVTRSEKEPVKGAKDTKGKGASSKGVKRKVGDYVHPQHIH